MADDPPAPSAESDVLAFFYSDAAGALTRLSGDAAKLASFAERLGRAVHDSGIALTEEQRAAFHHACELAARAAALTFRLLETLDIG